MRVFVVMAVVGMALLVAVVGGVPAPVRPEQGREMDVVQERAVAARADKSERVGTRRLAPERSLVWSARCIDQRDGRPIAGCRVTLVETAASGDQVVRTGRDGGFRVALPVELATVEVEVRSVDHVTVSMSVDPGEVATLPTEIRLRPATRVRGLLVDEHGVPCAGCRVTFASLAGANAGSRQRTRWQTWTRTEDDGTFAFATPLPAGAARIEAPDVPALLDDELLTLRPGVDQFVSLRCRSWSAADQVSGTVVDSDGVPVAEALVELVAGEPRDARVLRTTMAQPDGRFRLLRPAGAPSSVWLRAVRGPGRFAGGVSGPFAWGQQGIRVGLPRPVGLHVHVVDAAGGAPVERYALRCVPTRGARSSRAGRLRADGVHADGHSVVTGLAPGPYELQVLPGDRRWLPGLPQPVVVRDDGMTEVRVELVRARILMVCVEAASGEAIGGVRVQAVLPGFGGPVRELDRLLVHGGTRRLPDVRLAQAVTDDRGVARLRVPMRHGPLELRLDGADRPAVAIADIDASLSRKDVVLPARGLLELQLAGAAGAQVVLRSAEQRLPVAWAQPFELDAQGAARLPVPVGSWEVQLLTPAVAGGKWRGAPPIATVDVGADATTVLAQVVDRRTDGVVHGCAFVDGVPAAQVVLQLGEAADRGEGRPRLVQELVASPDERGRFRFDQLGAGPLLLQLRSTSAGRTLVLPQGGWRALAAGEQFDAGNLSVATAAVELTIQNGEQPAAGLLILRAGNGSLLAARLDVEGVARFERVPVGKCLVQLRAGRATHELGSLEIAAGRPTRTVLPLK